MEHEIPGGKEGWGGKEKSSLGGEQGRGDKRAAEGKRKLLNEKTGVVDVQTRTATGWSENGKCGKRKAGGGGFAESGNTSREKASNLFPPKARKRRLEVKWGKRQKEAFSRARTSLTWCKK